ncbi:elongin-A isoform X2 [Poecilia latipinna]|uniref:Elongin-A n=1 Tax=Poecilia latipinna TaxID=48699 RepID=A0A3B3TQT4_9TELE|nr:PREDICTED: transcription elongation factor B polypeptide 3 isoform X2 [Poecilia latipinna]
MFAGVFSFYWMFCGSVLKQRNSSPAVSLCSARILKQFPGDRVPAATAAEPPAAAMADQLLETVERLQSRIQDNPEPRKLLKTLKRLGEVQMTVDILVRTGVGKTVNSFRKHDDVGELAKSLVAKWKKLVPQTADRPNSHPKPAPQSHHRSYREPSPEEERSYVEEEEEEEMVYQSNYFPSPPQQQQYSPPQRGGYESEEYEPEPSPPPLPPPPLPPARKEIRHSKPSKNHHHRDEERWKAGSDRGGGKKRSADRERTNSPPPPQKKHSRKSTPHDTKKEEKKKGGEDARPRPPKDSPSKEDDDDFEAHPMSFESFLTYDAPTPVKKKKKQQPSSSSHSKPSQSSSGSSSRQNRTTASSSSSSSKANKANGSQSSKRSHSDSRSSEPKPEKRKRVVEALPTLLDIPLPAIQPNYRPLPSIDTPLSPQRRKVPVCNDEEDAGFTGKRFNSKMVVYSGSKTSYLPRMMTLYEQCIRVLQNNIDSIAEVGGVPFEILEPVLERCTPEQLYRIEQSNQCFTEDSDELWMRHCRRDFKRESPQEFESWREMYLRLHDEREERLRLLTQNISSAHANKPKGRQVKMAFVNSVAKPPRDVRRRQEKFGTSSSSSSASTAAASPIKIRPASSDFAGDSSRSSSSHFSSPAGSSRSSAPPGGGGGTVNPGREKPQVKKIAPMMAKTIKAFKNRFSRR